MEFKNELNSGPRIIAVSVEEVVSTTYSRFVKQQHLAGKSFAVFVEDAHLLAEWQGFCLCLGEFQQHLRSVGAHTSILELTATTPPKLAYQIAEYCGMKDSQTILT